MTQKVLKVGTSAAVTIPKKAMEQLGLKVGDRVEVGIDQRSKSLRIERIVKTDEELINWTDRFIERYRPALEALAKK